MIDFLEKLWIFIQEKSVIIFAISLVVFLLSVVYTENFAIQAVLYFFSVICFVNWTIWQRNNNDC